MENEKSNKYKLMKLLEILRNCTDDENYITTPEIIEKLKENGIKADRRTIYNNIAALQDSGYEILCEKSNGKPNKYCFIDDKFDTAELRILMDAVQAASFVTPSKTQVLANKIAKLAGVHKAETIKNNIMQFNTTKHTNEKIFYSINEIEKAIMDKKKITFLYFDYNANKERVYRENKQKYMENPYATVFYNGNYYLISYSEKHEKMTHYRIDRMDHVMIEQETLQIPKKFEDFDIKAHIKQVFGMFGGEEIQVVVEVVPKLINVVIDKFGENVEFELQKNGNVQFKTIVQNSPQFMGWCCSFGDELKVVSPKKIKDEIKKHIYLVLKNY